MTIPGWFPPTNKETLARLIAQFHVESVIEIGSFVGLSTVWFAERVKSVITIDPFDAITREKYLKGEAKEAAEHQFENFKKNTEAFDNITVIQTTSEEAARMLNAKADLVYVDGSHLYDEVKKDILLWYPRAIKIFCGDDYSPWWPGVRRAVDEAPFEVNKNQRLWYAVKRPNV